jgi:hypothetical protein
VLSDGAVKAVVVHEGVTVELDERRPQHWWQELLAPRRRGRNDAGTTAALNTVLTVAGVRNPFRIPRIRRFVLHPSGLSRR